LRAAGEAMGKLAEKPIPSAEEARAEIEGYLEKWRCELVAFDCGASNLIMPRRYILDKLDHYLDLLIELRGQ
jgi:hypothetical protein